MNLKETINELQRRFKQTKGRYFQYEISVEEYEKATKLAVKSLEKQIPKKVLYEDAGYNPWHDVNLYACICPSCGLHIIEFSDDGVDSKCDSDSPEDVFHSSMVHHGYIGLNNFCNRCGQKLKWEDGD